MDSDEVAVKPEPIWLLEDETVLASMKTELEPTPVSDNKNEFMQDIFISNSSSEENTCHGLAVFKNETSELSKGSEGSNDEIKTEIEFEEHIPLEYSPEEPDKPQGDGKLLCSVCGEQCSSLNSLSQHLKIHTRDIMYVTYSEVGGDDSSQVADSSVGNSDSCSKGTDTNRWTHHAILRLIHAYKENVELFLSSSVRNDVVWKRVGEKLQSEGVYFTPKQCEFKFKNMKRRYQAKVGNMKSTQSGAPTVRFQYFEEFQKMFDKKPNIDSVAIVSSSRGATFDEREDVQVLEYIDDDNLKMKDSSKVIKEPPKKRSKIDRHLSQIIELHEKKERGNERRHKELIELQKETIRTFSEKMDKLIDKL